MMTTHTYAVLKVSPATFAEIRQRLEHAGYDHAFHREDGRELIDMHGIALAADAVETRDATPIEVASIFGHKTRRGLVEVVLGGRRVQMELPKAREVRGMLDGAIEAAVSDELMVRFLTDKIGLTAEAAAAALLDFRELRQGSKQAVFPQ